tara:strand:- start:261 stop:569 length:309 start_codon:yes stop_codon:yes gene_type:complete
MKQTILKLKEKGIFKINSLVTAQITKEFMGSPVEKIVTLKVHELGEDYCLADEQDCLDYNIPMRKILFNNILTIDGMEPIELAAVYGLEPKTERFRRRETNK